MPKLRVSDHQFGELEWDDDYNRWSGTVTIGSNTVRVYIDASDDGSEEMGISENARKAYGIISESQSQIREKACLDLLETYNQAWNQGAQIDARTFMDRPILEAITIYREGMAEIFFGDDDMFWGHSIIVSMNESGEFDSAYLGG